jgi:hypothetical protein
MKKSAKKPSTLTASKTIWYGCKQFSEPLCDCRSGRFYPLKFKPTGRELPNTGSFQEPHQHLGQRWNHEH